MSYIKIIRPLNFFFVGLCVAMGAYYPEYELTAGIWQLLSAIVSAMFIAAAGYVINDYYDLEIDRVNKPERVLPSGKMKVRTALIYSILLFLAGIILSYFTFSVICLLIAFINSIFLFLYARFFKREFMVGNLLVAYAASSCFIYGGVAGNNIKNSLVIAAFAFLYTFLRELVKDLEDVKGDREAGAATIAIRWKKQKVVHFCLLPIMAMILFTLYFYYTGNLPNSQFTLLIFFVILPLLVFYRILGIHNKTQIYRQISVYMKLDMFLLLIILMTGRV